VLLAQPVTGVGITAKAAQQLPQGTESVLPMVVQQPPTKTLSLMFNNDSNDNIMIQ